MNTNLNADRDHVAETYRVLRASAEHLGRGETFDSCMENATDLGLDPYSVEWMREVIGQARGEIIDAVKTETVPAREIKAGDVLVSGVYANRVLEVEVDRWGNIELTISDNGVAEVLIAGADDDLARVTGDAR